MIYITTSRKPSQLTRRIARYLGRVFGTYENRGKRSMAEIVARANTAGYTRIMFMYEKKGNPSELSFYEDEWLEPLIKIRGVKENGGKSGKGFEINGPEWAKKLFGESEGANIIMIKNEKLWIEVDGDRVGPELKITVIKNGE